MPKRDRGSTNLRAKFQSDGFAMLRKLAEPDRLHAVQHAIARLLEIRSGRALARSDGTLSRRKVDQTLLDLHAASPKHKSYVYDTLPNLPEVVRLATSPRVLDSVRRCLGLGPRALVSFINVNLRIDLSGPEWEHSLPWHQDYPYKNKLYAQGASAVLWMPVFDCPRALGPVVIKPESHKAGEISTKEIKRDIGAPHWTIPEETLEHLPYEDAQFAMKAGDGIVFDILLVHRSAVNRQPDRIRWTLQARYSSPDAPTFLREYAVAA